MAGFLSDADVQRHLAYCELRPVVVGQLTEFLRPRFAPGFSLTDPRLDVIGNRSALALRPLCCRPNLRETADPHVIGAAVTLGRPTPNPRRPTPTDGVDSPRFSCDTGIVCLRSATRSRMLRARPLGTGKLSESGGMQDLRSNVRVPCVSQRNAALRLRC